MAKTRDIAAERAGFGGARTSDYASKVVEQGTPELVKAMDSGKASVSAAAVISDLPQAEQRQIVALSDDEIVRRAKARYQ